MTTVPAAVRPSPRSPSQRLTHSASSHRLVRPSPWLPPLSRSCWRRSTMTKSIRPVRWTTHARRCQPQRAATVLGCAVRSSSACRSLAHSRAVVVAGSCFLPLDWWMSEKLDGESRVAMTTGRWIPGAQGQAATAPGSPFALCGRCAIVQRQSQVCAPIGVAASSTADREMNSWRRHGPCNQTSTVLASSRGPR